MSTQFLVKDLVIKETRLVVSLRGVYLSVVSFEDLTVVLREFSLSKAPKQQV